jgi:two-component system, sensor histidine kinase and response regulator
VSRLPRAFRCTSRSARTSCWPRCAIQDPTSAQAALPQVADASATRFADARVVVAEDNPVNQMVMAGMLRMHGCSVAFAADGREVVDAVLQLRPDLVLMDCQMPVLSGIDAAREIRRRETDRRTPIVAVTANARRSDELECRDAGMDGFLTKPFSRAQLADLLVRFLGPRTGGASHAVSGSADALDVQALRRLGDPEVTRRIIDTYLAHTTGLLAKIREGVAQSDGRSITSAAHSLKSSSATIGARRVSELCKRLESLGREGSPKGAAELLESLEAAQTAAREALLRERDALANPGSPGGTPDA